MEAKPVDGEQFKAGMRTLADAVNLITSSVSDSLAMCPEYKVVSCRIRKARKTHLREAGEVVSKA